MQDYLSKNLKHLRKIKGLTQAEFADKLGIKRSTYAYSEKHGFSYKKLLLFSEPISKELGYSIEFLIKNDLQQQKTKENYKSGDIILALEIIEQQLGEIKKIIRK